MKFLLVCFFIFSNLANAENDNEVTPLELSANAKYIEETKTLKSSRAVQNKETDSRPLQHAKVDSELILDRYENKRFIKEKIQKIARDTASKKEVKQTIAQQMGEAGAKRISVSIDENINVKDAILEISHLASVDVEVDPEIQGGIILSLKNAKVADVLERVAELAELNISVKNGIVRFMGNKPYTKNYTIAFIDSMGGGVGGIGSGFGSQNMNAGGFIGGNNFNNGFGGGFNNGFGGGFNNGFGGGFNNGFGGGFNNGFGGIGRGLQTSNSLHQRGIGMVPQQNTMWEQFEEGLKYIVSQKKGVEYSINRQAGVVTLRAPMAVHQDVEEYVEKIKKLATTQILVEVRLVEVSLEDEFSSGIDFNYTSTNGNQSIAGRFVPATVANASGSPFLATINGAKNTGLKAAVQFLQTFGTTKTISSPRLNVMNNQYSQLSFAQDYVYFSIQPQLQNQFVAPGVTPTNPQTPIIVQSMMQTVPIGVILDIQATADIESEEITMSIRPTISSIVGQKEDPAASFLSGLQMAGTTVAGTITNTVPIVEKKELSSTLRIKSGDIMVIGGFNEERTAIVRKGIPYLKDVSFLKYLFGSDQKYVRNVETVIFIKATIIGEDNPISSEDTKFYNDFA